MQGGPPIDADGGIDRIPYARVRHYGDKVQLDDFNAS